MNSGSHLGDKLPVESQDGIRPRRVPAGCKFAMTWNDLQRLWTNGCIERGPIDEVHMHTSGTLQKEAEYIVLQIRNFYCFRTCLLPFDEQVSTVPAERFTGC